VSKFKIFSVFTEPDMGQMTLQGFPATLASKVGEDGHKWLNQCECIQEDILIHSINHFKLKEQLEKLFIRLRNAVKVNLAKCKFGATNVSYLGYRLTPDEILPGSNKLRATKDSNASSTVKEIRQFMGLCNFFSLMSGILPQSVGS
jgi:hypothetical protein